MLEDLWRSAKAMERRIETLESLLAARDTDTHRRPPRSTHSHLDD
jgi:phage shock protein B